MNYYDRFSPDLMRTIKELNDKMREEENVINPDKEKISDLRTYIIHHSNYIIEHKSIVK